MSAPLKTKESHRTADTAIYREHVAAGAYWMHIVTTGQTLRLVDVEGNQAADTLFFNAADPSERYSATDTIREQGNIYLGTGTTILSDKCRPMLTITADTVGRHDTIGGACATESNTVRYALEKKPCTLVATAIFWPSPRTSSTASPSAISAIT